MGKQISLSPKAVSQINDILSGGGEVQIAIRGNKLVMWETRSKKRYEVAVSQPH